MQLRHIDDLLIQVQIANNPHTTDRSFIEGLIAARRQFEPTPEIDRSKVNALKSMLDQSNKRLSQK